MNIREGIEKYLGSNCLVSNISSEKLNKAITYITHGDASVSEIIGVYDATILGSMKKGFAITNDGIYFSSCSRKILFKEIGSVSGWSKHNTSIGETSKFSIYGRGQNRIYDIPWIQLSDSYLIGPAGDRCAQFLNVVDLFKN